MEASEQGVMTMALKLLWRRKLRVFLVSLLVMVGATTVVLMLPVKYRAATTIIVDARRSEAVRIDAVLSNLPNDADAFYSELEVITSRGVLDKVIQKLDLAADPEFNPNLRSGILVQLRSRLSDLLATYRASLTDNEAPPAPPASQMADSVYENLLGHLEIAPIGRSRVIRITATAADARRTAQIANAVAEAYVGSVREQRQRVTEEAHQWIGQHLQELQAKATASADKVEKFRAENGLARGRDATLLQQEASEVSSQLSAIRARKREATLMLQQAAAAIAAGNTEALGSILSSPVIQKLREQESTVAARRAELANRFGANHPSLTGVTAELGSVRERLYAEAQRIMQSVRDGLEVSSKVEQTTTAYLQKLSAESAVSGRGPARLQELEREAETDRALYTSFLARSKETGPDMNFETDGIRILSRAAQPTAPAFPQTMKLLPVLAGLSALAGLLAAIASEEFCIGMITERDAEGRLGLPVLGIVPIRRRRAFSRYMFEEAIFNLCARILMLREASQPGMVVLRDGVVPQTIVMTSALPHEGKTTTAIALARAAALSGRRVVLVDGDLRRGSASAMLNGASVAAGLTDVLDGSCTGKALPHHRVQAGLYLITAGLPTSNPGRLLAAPALRDLMVLLQQQYDLVIIDTPPVLVGSDASMFARHATQTVMLVRWASTSAESAIAAYKHLAAGGANIAGVVMSMVNTRNSTYQSYSGASLNEPMLQRYYSTKAIAR